MPKLIDDIRSRLSYGELIPAEQYAGEMEAVLQALRDIQTSSLDPMLADFAGVEAERLALWYELRETCTHEPATQREKSHATLPRFSMYICFCMIFILFVVGSIVLIYKRTSVNESTISSKPATKSLSLPPTCAEGQLYLNMYSGGANVYICTEANSWLKSQ